MAAFELSAAFTLTLISAGSRGTGSTVTLPPKVSWKPLQRRSRPTFPTSWLTQSPTLPPISFSLAPAARPATISS
jgi:hypothetical protein